MLLLLLLSTCACLGVYIATPANVTDWSDTDSIENRWVGARV